MAGYVPGMLDTQGEFKVNPNLALSQNQIPMPEFQVNPQMLAQAQGMAPGVGQVVNTQSPTTLAPPPVEVGVMDKIGNYLRNDTAKALEGLKGNMSNPNFIQALGRTGAALGQGASAGQALNPETWIANEQTQNANKQLLNQMFTPKGTPGLTSQSVTHDAKGVTVKTLADNESSVAEAAKAASAKEGQSVQKFNTVGQEGSQTPAVSTPQAAPQVQQVAQALQGNPDVGSVSAGQVSRALQGGDMSGVDLRGMDPQTVAQFMGAAGKLYDTQGELAKAQLAADAKSNSKFVSAGSYVGADGQQHHLKMNKVTGAVSDAALGSTLPSAPTKLGEDKIYGVDSTGNLTETTNDRVLQYNPGTGKYEPNTIEGSTNATKSTYKTESEDISGVPHMIRTRYDGLGNPVGKEVLGKDPEYLKIMSNERGNSYWNTWASERPDANGNTLYAVTKAGVTPTTKEIPWMGSNGLRAVKDGIFSTQTQDANLAGKVAGTQANLDNVITTGKTLKGATIENVPALQSEAEFVNEHASNSYLYAKKDPENDKIFGIKMPWKTAEGLQKIELPIVAGKQVSSSDVVKYEKNNHVTREVAIQKVSDQYRNQRIAELKAKAGGK
jgi:hypothetical protein